MDKALAAYANSLKNYKSEQPVRDFELEAATERVNQLLRHPFAGMSIEFRISAELGKRANTALNLFDDEYALNRIDRNNKLALEADINRRKIAAKRGLYWSANLQKFVTIPE